MPRYLVETAAISSIDRDRVAVTASVRFPEVAIEQRYSARDEDGGRDIWVCRAPSAAHLRRWAGACRLALARLQLIDAERSTE